MNAFSIHNAIKAMPAILKFIYIFTNSYILLSNLISHSLFNHLLITAKPQLCTLHSVNQLSRHTIL